MSAELYGVGATGAVHYAIVMSIDGLVWNGAAFEAWNDSHYANYPIAMTEQGSSGIYLGDSPNSNVRSYTMRYRVGGSPAISDYIVWNGQLSADMTGGGPSQVVIGDRNAYIK